MTTLPNQVDSHDRRASATDRWGAAADLLHGIYDVQ